MLGEMKKDECGREGVQIGGVRCNLLLRDRERVYLGESERTGGRV